MTFLLALLTLFLPGVKTDGDLRLTVHRVAGDASHLAVGARVATGPADKIYVAWISGGEVLVTSALTDAEQWLKPTTVSSGRSTAWGGHGEGPSLAVDRLGYVYLAWTDRARGAHDTDILFTHSGADVAESLAKPTAVNQGGNEASRTFQALAVDEKGRVYVAWQEEGAGAPRILLATSDDGSAFEEHEASRGFPGVPCECCRLSLVPAAGRVWLAFRENVNDVRDIFAAATADGGRSFNYPVLVSPDRWHLTSCPMVGPSIAVDQRGRPLVGWWTGRDDGTGRIALARATDDGRGFERPLIEIPVMVATSRPALAVRDQYVVLAWEDVQSGKPFVQAIYSDDGGRSFVWVRGKAPGGGLLVWPGRSPAVALDSKGRPIVSWCGPDSDPAVFVAR